jgi:glycosyltransferase involved in cell wall biosynthesis
VGDFEVIVADDGSTDHTRDVIEQVRRESDLLIRQVWQEHQGFRKCRILNCAILAARSDYLIFSDGDCIPRDDFVARHLELARPGWFLSGGVVRLPMETSCKITIADVFAGHAHSPRWLMAHGATLTAKLRMLAVGWWSGALVDMVTPTRPTFNGHNSSAWRCDVVRVGGFDERLAYGGLDRELGERLVRAGVRPRQIRHRAVCVHLDHPRGYVTQAAIAANRALRRRNEAERTVWTDFGLALHRDEKQSAAGESAAELGGVPAARPLFPSPDSQPRTHHAA